MQQKGRGAMEKVERKDRGVTDGKGCQGRKGVKKKGAKEGVGCKEWKM